MHTQLTLSHIELKDTKRSWVVFGARSQHIQTRNWESNAKTITRRAAATAAAAAVTTQLELKRRVYQPKRFCWLWPYTLQYAACMHACVASVCVRVNAIVVHTQILNHIASRITAMNTENSLSHTHKRRALSRWYYFISSHVHDYIVET